MRGTSWLAEDLLACQEWLSTIEFLSKILSEQRNKTFPPPVTVVKIHTSTYNKLTLVFE
jgi:hypothetical protein